MSTEDKKFPRVVETTFGQTIEECSLAEFIDLDRQGFVVSDAPAEGAEFIEPPDPGAATADPALAAAAAPKKKGA